MKLKNLLIFTALVCISFTAISQTETKKKTNVNTDVDVTVVYEQVVKEGYGTAFIYKELANAYYFKNNHLKAKQWFEQLFEVEKPTDETLKFRYKQTLKALNIAIASNQYLSTAEVSN
ncbi:hypothetical protein ATE92_0816 [Ulvibacter sp. MAR_2010_11]|uniref:hypothetical protein n=1 Tax=Ulvibacter sp. MAR_2010_11 TaxID=1250229 RepID=UPI000C2C4967|nr:hypothetical protein [Ulvibacter sp. MAR_2010_11]PKA82680.1 hypothetical protein ATE92_0816 [Ulvibacter sp. MAR_2010_11]